MVDSLDLKSSGIYSRGGSSPPEATRHILMKSSEIKISVIIPYFNEKNTIEILIDRIINCEVTIFEIILINDCSSDNSEALLDSLQKKNNTLLSVYHKKKNEGKGFAIKDGIDRSNGNVILIQDADLEYDPIDYKTLIDPFINKSADVVYGSRFLGSQCRVIYFWNRVANMFLTNLSNIFTNLNMTDIETGYKVFKSSVLKDINIEESRFGFEPEITAKIAKKKLKIYEVPISYDGRTYEEGKKIGLKDGIRAIFCIFKYNLLRK